MLGILCTRCRGRIGKKIVPDALHYLEIRLDGRGIITLDRVPVGHVLSRGDTSAFCAYLISFTDSSGPSGKASSRDITAKYYQYQMEKDWVVLDRGDSVRAVFYQPNIKISKHRKKKMTVEFP